MKDYEKEARILKALADKSRLQILDCIEKEISNPGEIARELKRHRATVEKHLRVLLVAGIVEKVPSLTKRGQLSLRYCIRKDAQSLISVMQDAIEKLWG